MSEHHEHTPGLIQVGGLEHDDWGMIRGADGMPLASTSMQCRIPNDWPCGDEPPPEVKANAERLVACWNNAHGVPTHEIEEGPDLLALDVELSKAKGANAERMEELAMLKECNADFLDACQGDVDPEMWRVAWLESTLNDIENGVLNEDPEARDEALAECRDLARLLRAAMKVRTP